jgi:hypothetical protein
LVERLVRYEKVRGSTPLGSTIVIVKDYVLGLSSGKHSVPGTLLPLCSIGPLDPKVCNDCGFFAIHKLAGQGNYFLKRFDVTSAVV